MRKWCKYTLCFQAFSGHDCGSVVIFFYAKSTEMNLEFGLANKPKTIH